MQQFFKKSAVMAILTVLCISGWSFAADEGANPPPPPGGLHLLMKYQMDNLMAEVMSEISEQDLETVQSELEKSDPFTLLQNYGLDESKFHSAMKEKMIELVNTVKSNGQITQVQAEEVIEDINTHSAP